MRSVVCVCVFIKLFNCFFLLDLRFEPGEHSVNAKAQTQHNKNNSHNNKKHVKITVQVNFTYTEIVRGLVFLMRFKRLQCDVV